MATSTYEGSLFIDMISELRAPHLVPHRTEECTRRASVWVPQEILPEFFRNFWVRRMALDRRNYRQLVDSTLTVARKTGCSEIVGRIVEDLKDESEPYRRMVMETIDKVQPPLQGSVQGSVQIAA